jgi:hypothetical protein
VHRGPECLSPCSNLTFTYARTFGGGQKLCKKTATSPTNPSPHKPLPQMRRRGELIGLKACHHRSKQLTMLMLFVGLLMFRRVVDTIWKYYSNVSSATGENCLYKGPAYTTKLIRIQFYIYCRLLTVECV